ncbi:hypothetical protein ACFRAE_17510 [Sphingobacterium sp. HJSM2_6]|uniref:hypothetical protein n=1 Tax=Sphingobacterium sp. HJSM2_6 TaxID=3366264 RepID=UPI003BC33B23
MKRIYIIFLVLSFLFSCTKEKESPKNSVITDKIKLETLVPVSLFGYGIQFAGRVLHLNDEVVKEHGFIVKYKVDFNQFDSIYVKIDKTIASGDNVQTLKESPLPKFQDEYSVKYVIKTASNIYSGTFVNFKTPDIRVDSDEEMTLIPGSRVNIKGDFTKVDESYKLSYAGEDIQETAIHFEILGSNRDMLTFTVPKLYHGDFVRFVLFNRYDNKNVVAIGFIKGEISGLNQYEYYFDENLSFTSNAVKQNIKGVLFFIVGNKYIPLNYAYPISDVLAGLKGNSFRVGYYNGQDTIFFPKKLSLRPVTDDAFVIKDFNAHPMQDVSVNTYLLTRFTPELKTNYSIGGKLAKLYRYWNGNDVLTIGDVADGAYSVNIKSDYVDFNTTKKINIKKLQVTSVSPAEIYHGEPIILKGNFIDGQTYTIDDNDEQQSYGVARNGQIQIYPYGRTVSTYEIKRIGYKRNLENYAWIDASFKVNFKRPTFTGFSPASGNSQTAIRFYGKGIGAGMVFLGNEYLSFNNYGEGWAELYLPSYIRPGFYKFSIFYQNSWLTVDQVYEHKWN